MARQRGVRRESQALACEVLDNRRNAEAAPHPLATGLRREPDQGTRRNRKALGCGPLHDVAQRIARPIDVFWRERWVD